MGFSTNNQQENDGMTEVVVLSACVTKTSLQQNVGLHLMEDNGNDGIIRIREVEKEGPFATFTNLQPGDQVLRLQDKDISHYSRSGGGGAIRQMEMILDKSLQIRIQVLRRQQQPSMTKPTLPREDFGVEVDENDYQNDKYDEDDEDDTSVMSVAIAVGDIMILQGMTRTTTTTTMSQLSSTNIDRDLNGQIVKVKGQTEDDNGWLVQLHQSGTTLVVQEENLTMAVMPF